jgi:hypothetical protein
MKFHDAFFAAAAFSLALLSCAGIAVSAPYFSNTPALQADYGFDALAHQVFGDQLCAIETTRLEQ